MTDPAPTNIACTSPPTKIMVYPNMRTARVSRCRSRCRSRLPDQVSSCHHLTIRHAQGEFEKLIANELVFYKRLTTRMGVVLQ